MSELRCFYEVLGIQREASADEIRKAYRQLARKHHPDQNPGDAKAEERFKEVTEAYQVLADDDKRARYDRFGHAGVNGGGGGGPQQGDIFSHFQDIFSEFFGGMGGGRQQRRGPARGHDVRIQQRITLREAMEGVKREVTLRTPVACEACAGSGAKAGTKRKACGTCNGQGQVSISRGFVMFSQTCPECSGQGSVVKTPCETCHGNGHVEKPRKVVVTFPAGIDAGQRLRVPGQGMPSDGGGQPGDLYVDVDVAPHERFERDGTDLVTKVVTSFADAALGATVSLELPNDKTVSVDVPAGTQPGDVISLRGQGMPRVDGRGRGSLQVIVQVEVPRRVSARAQELLAELRRELGGEPPAEPPVERPAGEERAAEA